MSLRNVTIPQAMIVIALLAATVTAYKLFGEVPAGVMLVIQALVSFLMGRDAPLPPNPDANGKPDLKLIDGGADKGGPQ